MKNSFEDCISLENVSNINNILESCFRGCVKLSRVEIADDAAKIGIKSFENCNSLESIKIPSSIKTISEYAFINCRNLKIIEFQQRNSLTKISINSFLECNSLQSINNFESDNYKCIDNTLYLKNETGEYLIFHAFKSSDKILRINCSVICSYSFNECIAIEKINILPNSVSLIEKYSFNKCFNLQHINFPLSVHSVESHSFVECHSIRYPLIIENTSNDYIKMIIESGISPHIIISCQPTANLQAIKQLFNNSPNLYWRYLSK
ncbi:surface antigen BspA-like [Trichomonas vaginalis G3]|uniref:Surface antigen BspA-like n=1 Tax=Trichomonas vaginalis (strain ATCC PRA-98 / G3) TaxID=412133 RepID=A2FG17_TRIV3|nr:ribonuclease inhibitor domain-containing protein [Trichomonas vaginalis G3]EAX96136.1 surface antigen BspA-like [Trichomonas vaginalis G3]KAI5507445.1 ribonuclease inhibitor domain-containing protein [Trichomonas vaginalis G3]|eukprot:XP_001309066.1 surface antigen BspA-like [Trichomonas vaginalis G3]